MVPGFKDKQQFQDDPKGTARELVKQQFQLQKGPIEAGIELLKEAQKQILGKISLKSVIVFIDAGKDNLIILYAKKEGASKDDIKFSTKLLSISTLLIDDVIKDSKIPDDMKATPAAYRISSLIKYAERQTGKIDVKQTAKLTGAFQQNILVWKAQFEKILEMNREGSAKAKEIAGAFINMVLDPMNSQHTANLRSKIAAFETDLAAGKDEALDAAAILLGMFGGMYGVGGKAANMLDALDKLATQLQIVQTNTAMLDNSAQFVKSFDKIKAFLDKVAKNGTDISIYNASKERLKTGEELGLKGYDAAYYDARIKVGSTAINPGSGYTNYELYQAVSQAYIGDYTSYYKNEKGYTSSGKYLGRDLIALYEGMCFKGGKWVRATYTDKQNKKHNVVGLLEDKVFQKMRKEFQEDFGSRSILSMNLRAQYDLFYFTKPAMEKQGLWNKGGIKLLEQVVAKLDPTLGFTAETITPSSGITAAFSISEFSKQYDAGRLPYTLFTLQNGQQVSGAVTKNSSGNYVVGNLTINGTTGAATLKVNGQTTTVQVLSFLVPNEASNNTKNFGVEVDITKVADMSVLQQFPSVKLEGFFAHAMPILARYPESTRMDMVDIISACQDAIIAQWSTQLPTTSVISDITSARMGVIKFNIDLEKLLLSTNVKDVAINELKSSTKLSDIKTVNQWEKTFKDLTDDAFRQTVVMNPYVNVHYSGVDYYKEHEGTWLSPGSEADLNRFFSPQSLQMVQDPIEPSINIDKYAYSMSAAVVKNMTDAITLYGPKEAPKLYFNSSDFYAYYNLQNENDKSYHVFNTGYFGFWGKNTFFDFNLETIGSEKMVDAGSFRTSLKNMPFFKTGVNIQDARFVTDFTNDKKMVFDRVEAYMLAQAPLDNNAAFYIMKDNNTGKFSVRIGARTTGGKFKTIAALENLEDTDVAVLVSHFELNNEVFGPSFTTKFNSELPSDRDAIMKYLQSKDFAGMMFAANFGPKFAAAYFDDPKFDSKNLSEQVRDALVNDNGRTLFWPSKYEHRQALSMFWDMKKDIGLYADITNTKLSETYIDAIDPRTGEKIKKKVEDTKMSPDEFSVRFVKDKSYSVQASLNRRMPGETGIDSYSFDGKMKVGKTAFQLTTLFGNSLGLLPPSFANLDLSEKIGSTRLVVTSSDVLRRYAFVNLLYNTKGKIWEPNDVLSRSIAARYDNLLGMVNTSLGVAEQYSKAPGYRNNGFGAIFTDGSRSVFKKFDYDLQAAGNYNNDMYLVGANVRNIKFKGGSISIGALGGSYNQYDDKTRKQIVAGIGARISLKDIKIAIQAAYLGDPKSFAGALGLNYDKKTWESYTVLSGRVEDKDSYQAWNLYQMLQANQFGVYFYYDNEKLEILTNPSDIESRALKMREQVGGQLFYSSPNGMWRVNAGLVWRQEIHRGRDYYYDSRLSATVGVEYTRVAGQDRPWFVPDILQRGEFVLETDLRRTEGNEREGVVAKLNLHFSPF